MIYVKGTGTWDKTFDIITTSLKKIKTYLDKEGIKPDGLPMTIFTASDDNGFDYEIGIPIAAPPKNPPHGEFAIGQTPDGAALKFVYRGSYDDLDNTYETITDYLDEKRLDAKEMIEEYVTDPLTADAEQAGRQCLRLDQTAGHFAGLKTDSTITAATPARAATCGSARAEFRQPARRRQGRRAAHRSPRRSAGTCRNGGPSASSAPQSMNACTDSAGFMC